MDAIERIRLAAQNRRDNLNAPTAIESEAVGEAVTDFQSFIQSFNNPDADSVLDTASQASDAATDIFNQRPDAYAYDGTIGHLQNLGVGVLQGAAGVVSGVAHLIASPETSQSISEATDLSNWRTDESRARDQFRTGRADEYAKSVDIAVDQGRINTSTGEILKAKHMISNLDLHQIVDLTGGAVGSLAPAFVAGMVAGPGAAAAMLGYTGMSSLGEVAQTIRDDLYSKDADGDFEVSHELLLDSSERYRAVFEETGSEQEAREAVFNALRLEGVTDYGVIAATLAETLGDAALLRLGKFLKPVKKSGSGPRSAGRFRNYVGSMGKEGAAEVLGDTTRELTAQSVIRDEYDPDRNIYKDVGPNIVESALGGVAGAGSTPAMRVTGAVAAGAAALVGSDARQERTNRRTIRDLTTTEITDENVQEQATRAAEVLTDNPSELLPKVNEAEATEEVTKIREQAELVYNFMAQPADVDTLPEMARDLAEDGDTLARLLDKVKVAYEAALTGNDIASAAKYARDIQLMHETFRDAYENSQAYVSENGQEGMKNAFAMAKQFLQWADGPKVQESLDALGDLLAKAEISFNPDGSITDEGMAILDAKLEMYPETLSEAEVDAAMNSLDAFTDIQQQKIQAIRDFLNTAKDINERYAEAGSNQDLDVVSRQVTTDAEPGAKGLSVMSHALKVMELMRNGNETGAEIQMGRLFNFIRSHRNKLNAINKAIAEGTGEATYQTYAANSSTPVTRKIPVYGDAANLVRNISAELDFMRESYTKLSDAYEGIARPLPAQRTQTARPAPAPRSQNTEATLNEAASTAGRTSPAINADSVRQWSMGNLNSSLNDNTIPEEQRSIIQAELDRRAAPEPAFTPEQVSEMTDTDLRAYASEIRDARKDRTNPTVQANWSLVQAELNRRANPEQVTEPTTPVVDQTALNNARQHTSTLVNRLQNEHPAAFSNFYNQVIDRVDANEFNKFLDGVDNNLTIDDLRMVYRLANNNLNIAASQPTQPTQPTQTAAPVKPAAEPAPAVEEPVETPMSLTERVTQAIESASDNVRQVMVQGRERPYVLIDGKVYNEKGKEIIAAHILRAFDGEVIADPDAEVATVTPTTDAIPEGVIDLNTQEPAEATDAEKQAAKSFKDSIPVGKYWNIAADRTRMYVSGFFDGLRNRLTQSSDPVEQTFGHYLNTAIEAFTHNFGTYTDGVPSQGSILSKVHERMNDLVVSTLANSNARPSAVQIMKEAVEELTGSTLTDSQYQDWMAQNIPPIKFNKQTKAAAIQAERARINELFGESRGNQLIRDLASKWPQLRLLDLLEYNADTNQFSMPDTVMNAASTAFVEFASNFQNYVDQYAETYEIEDAFGINGSVDINYRGENNPSEVSVESLARNGIIRTADAMVRVSDTAMKMLGARGINTAGTGLSQGPMQSLIATMFDYSNHIFEDLVPFKVGVMKSSMDVHVITGNPQLNNANEVLRSAKDMASKELLVDPERARYINQIPKVRTTNKAGERLTNKQYHALKQQVSIPGKLNTRLDNLWRVAFGKEGIIQFLGYPEAMNPDHPMNRYDREAKMGKNIQLSSSIDELVGINKDIEQSGSNRESALIYHNSGISSVGRIMQDGGNTPQGDKVIRSAISHHVTEIDASTFLDYISPEGSIDSATGMDTFLTLAYGQAFGLKIQNMTPAQTRDELSKLMNQEGFRELAEHWLMAAQTDKRLRPSSLNSLKNRMEAMGIPLEEIAIQTMVELGALYAAGENASTFTTHAYIEADGITNGPFMAGMLVGIDPTDADWIRFMTNGGLYIGGDINGNQYRSDAAAEGALPDNYTAVSEVAAVGMKAALQRAFNFEGFQSGPNTFGREITVAAGRVLKNVFSHIGVDASGKLTMSRNTAKNPVTVTFYGSSAWGIADKFFKEMNDYIHEFATDMLNMSEQELAEAYIKGDGSPEAKVTELRHLKKAIDIVSSGAVRFGVYGPYVDKKNVTGRNWISRFNHGDEKLQHVTVSDKRKQNIKTNLQSFMVDPLVESLGSLADSTLTGAKTVGNATNAFSVMLAAQMNNQIDQLMAEQGYDSSVGLSPNQVKEVKKSLAAFGLTGSVADQVFAMYKESRAVMGHQATGVFQSNASAWTAGEMRTLAPRGVSGIPAFVISSGDAATIGNFLNQLGDLPSDKVLQVYDGINLAADNYREGSKLANDSVREAVNPEALANLASAIDGNMLPLVHSIVNDPKLTWDQSPIYTFADLLDSYEELKGRLGEKNAKLITENGLRILGANLYNIDEISQLPESGKEDLALSSGMGFQLLPSYVNSHGQLREYLKGMESGMAAAQYVQLQANNVALADTSFEQFMASTRDSDSTFIELPGYENAFSTEGLKRLSRRVTQGHELLNQAKNTIDQMAGTGDGSVSDGGVELDATTPEDIADWFQKRTSTNKRIPYVASPDAMQISDAVLNRFFKPAQEGVREIMDSQAARVFYSEQVRGAFPKGSIKGVLASRLGIILQAAMQNGLKITYDPNAAGAHYNPATNTVVLVDGNPVAAVHEMIHGLTTNALDAYYSGNVANLSKSSIIAIQNLETLLGEVMGSPSSINDPKWARAIEHIRQAGNRVLFPPNPLAQARPELVKARQISELIAIFLTDPTLSAEAEKRPVKSKLRQLSDGILNWFKSFLRLPSTLSDNSLYRALAENTLVLANNDYIQERIQNPKPREGDLTASTEPSLEMFDPDPFTRGMHSEIKDIADRLAAIQGTTESILDTTLTDLGQEFATAGFQLDANQRQSIKTIAAFVAEGTQVSDSKELYRLAAHVMRNLTPEHFGDTSVPGSAEYYTAHNMHTAVTGSAVRSRRAMVPALVALTVVSPQMKEAVNKLGVPKGEQSTETDSPLERRIGQFGYDAISALNNHLGGSRNTLPADRMQELLNAVKKPEGRANGIMAFPAKYAKKANDALASALNYAGQKAGNLGRDAARKNSKLEKALGLSLQGIGAILDTETANAMAEGTMSVMAKTNSFHDLKDLAREFIGRTEGNAAVYDLTKMVRSFVQRSRQMFVEGTPKTLLNKFNKKPTDAQMRDLNKSMADTDIAAVADSISASEALDLLSDKTRVTQRINDLKSKIGTDDIATKIISKAEQLAHYMVTTETGNNLLTNATHIVSLYGEPESDGMPLRDWKAVDELVSLLAFQQSDNSTFHSLVQNEREAMEYLLATMKGFRAEELNKTENGMPQGIKGYMPVRTSGSMRIIPDHLREQYERKGYVRVADYVIPSQDVDRTPRGYYISPVSDTRPFAQGVIQNAVSTINGVEEGSRRFVGDNIINVNMTEADLVRFRRNPNSNTAYGLIPIYDNEGIIIGAGRAVDPSVLAMMDRDTNLATSLGIWRGRQVEEATAKQFNEVIVDVLNDNYQKSTNKDEYINLLEPESYRSNPVWKDAVSVMSQNALQYAKARYGGLWVSRSMMTNVAGYRQLGLGDIWSKDGGEIRQGIARAMDLIVGPKAHYYAIRADEIISGLVADAKQIIVVKSGIIPAINALSNILHLLGRGVPIDYIVRAIPHKLSEIEEYSKGLKRLIEIETDISAAEGNPAEIRRLRAEETAINEYHKKLSIWPLLSAGEFTSIVSTQIDAESTNLTKGKVAEYIENQLNKLDGKSKTFAKNVLITKDTAIYQALQKSVDYGDFIAKAILYDYRTKEENISHRVTMGQIREEFVNYDFLPGRIRGALERLGLLWFFNYKIRSVKVAAAMIRENPLHVLMASTLPTGSPIGNIDMPTTANIATQLLDGSYSYTVGPGMGFRAPTLHPLAQILN